MEERKKIIKLEIEEDINRDIIQQGKRIVAEKDHASALINLCQKMGSAYLGLAWVQANFSPDLGWSLGQGACMGICLSTVSTKWPKLAKISHANGIVS